MGFHQCSALAPAQVLSSERKLSPLVKDGNPWLPRMVHVSPPVDRQFPASLLATDKQGHGQKKNMSCLVWTPDKNDPWLSWQKSPAFPRSPAFTDTRLCTPSSGAQWSTQPWPRQGSKGSPASLCPPHMALQPSAAGFLPLPRELGQDCTPAGSGRLG